MERFWKQKVGGVSVLDIPQEWVLHLQCSWKQMEDSWLQLADF